MVFLNLGKGSELTHPIHVHGHTFEVIKMGFPAIANNGSIIPILMFFVSLESTTEIANARMLPGEMVIGWIKFQESIWIALSEKTLSLHRLVGTPQ